MPRHPDFERIHKRFLDTYGTEQGEQAYYAFINKKGYEEDKPFPIKNKTEKKSYVHGFELKELEGKAYLFGFPATSHPDRLGELEHGIADILPKETLESFARQLNTAPSTAGVFGLNHSETKGDYYGEAATAKYPAQVVELPDGEYALQTATYIDPMSVKGKKVVEKYNNGELWGLSITYDTQGFQTCDFEYRDGELYRIIGPETKLCGYTGTDNPANPQATTTGFSFKEYKELLLRKQAEEKTMTEDVKNAPLQEVKEASAEGKMSNVSISQDEYKEFLKQKRELEEKVLAQRVAEQVMAKMATMEKKEARVMMPETEQKELPVELKSFKEILEKPTEIEVKEQFRRASDLADKYNLFAKGTKPAESREYKNFKIGGSRGTRLEAKSLSVTTNQQTDADYLQSAAELNDVYDPVIYNALNEATVFWNVLSKDDYSSKGNNQVQFTLKTAANASAGFYLGNAIATSNTTRTKYQTKFKKAQAGVEIDGDMIASARGGAISDVFGKEVEDATTALLAVINAALFAEIGLETASAVIGMEYLTDSAGNTSLYNVTRSAANKLAPDSATDNYIDNGGGVVQLTNLRKLIVHCVKDGSNKRDLVFVTSPTQGRKLRDKMDAERRALTPQDTRFGFETDLFVDGVPVFEDKDVNTDDWFITDLSAHRVAVWVPPTLEMLGKLGDSMSGFVKTYFAVYHRAPRRCGQLYNCDIA